MLACNSGTSGDWKQEDQEFKIGSVVVTHGFNSSRGRSSRTAWAIQKNRLKNNKTKQKIKKLKTQPNPTNKPTKTQNQTKPTEKQTNIQNLLVSKA